LLLVEDPATFGPIYQDALLSQQQEETACLLSRLPYGPKRLVLADFVERVLPLRPSHKKASPWPKQAVEEARAFARAPNTRTRIDMREANKHCDRIRQGAVSR